MGTSAITAWSGKRGIQLSSGWILAKRNGVILNDQRDWENAGTLRIMASAQERKKPHEYT
jgi:hypothetical protein